MKNGFGTLEFGIRTQNTALLLDGHHGGGTFRTVHPRPDAGRLAASTLHRWLMDGFIAGEQVTPGGLPGASV